MQARINSDRTGWVEGAYAQEAERRGLSFRACDEMNNSLARRDEGRSASPASDLGQCQKRFDFVKSILTTMYQPVIMMEALSKKETARGMQVMYQREADKYRLKALAWLAEYNHAIEPICSASEFDAFRAAAKDLVSELEEK